MVQFCVKEWESPALGTQHRPLSGAQYRAGARAGTGRARSRGFPPGPGPEKFESSMQPTGGRAAEHQRTVAGNRWTATRRGVRCLFPNPKASSSPPFPPLPSRHRSAHSTLTAIPQFAIALLLPCKDFPQLGTGWTRFRAQLTHPERCVWPVSLVSHASPPF